MRPTDRDPVDDAEVSMRRWFPASQDAVMLAREWIAGVAVASGHDHAVATLQLLVSELATNAVVHAEGDGFLVEFDANGHLVVGVCDADPVTPTPRHPEPTDAGGRGLEIVDALSDRWGAEVRRNGKCVWFRLTDPISAPARSLLAGRDG